jgi:hypothetical protein
MRFKGSTTNTLRSSKLKWRKLDMLRKKEPTSSEQLSSETDVMLDEQARKKRENHIGMSDGLDGPLSFRPREY